MTQVHDFQDSGQARLYLFLLYRCCPQSLRKATANQPLHGTDRCFHPMTNQQSFSHIIPCNQDEKQMIALITDQAAKKTTSKSESLPSRTDSKHRPSPFSKVEDWKSYTCLKSPHTFLLSSSTLRESQRTFVIAE